MPGFKWLSTEFQPAAFLTHGVSQEGVDGIDVVLNSLSALLSICQIVSLRVLAIRLVGWTPVPPSRAFGVWKQSTDHTPHIIRAEATMTTSHARWRSCGAAAASSRSGSGASGPTSSSLRAAPSNELRKRVPAALGRGRCGRAARM